MFFGLTILKGFFYITVNFTAGNLESYKDKVDSTKNIFKWVKKLALQSTRDVLVTLLQLYKVTTILVA